MLIICTNAQSNETGQPAGPEMCGVQEQHQGLSLSLSLHVVFTFSLEHFCEVLASGCIGLCESLWIVMPGLFPEGYYIEAFIFISVQE